MPIREYERIQSSLHVSKRQDEHMRGTPNYDKLGKVHWLIDHLSEAFMKYNNCQLEQSIDEGIVFIVDLIVYN